jgi:hypothetical protein
MTDVQGLAACARVWQTLTSRDRAALTWSNLIRLMRRQALAAYAEPTVRKIVRKCIWRLLHAEVPLSLLDQRQPLVKTLLGPACDHLGDRRLTACEEHELEQAWQSWLTLEWIERAMHESIRTSQ